MRNITQMRVKLWQLVLPGLLLADAAYFLHNWLGSVVTLLFFLLVPGYLLLGHFKHGVVSRWEVLSFSLGLSILLLMVGGLALNALHAVGLDRPLAAPNIFIMLNVLTFVLLIRNRNKALSFGAFRLRSSVEEVVFISLLTLLPFLAAGGAIRLNNGGSNILTMLLFGAIPVILVLLLWRKNMKHLYPYAIFTLGTALLFSTSLRGWFITGHDIHHEFSVFQNTLRDGYWSVLTSSGDPYNACLSITILPTLLAKISAVADPYIYKIVYQLVFITALVPIYYLARRLSNERLALLGAFVFMSFPTFLNDMPFLNRQEIAFLFFGLLLSVTFLKMAWRPKAALTACFLAALIMAHYSTSYATIELLLFAWVLFRILGFRRMYAERLALPVLSLPLLIAALLFTFMWNAQITASTSNLRGTLVQTAKDLFQGNSSKAGFIQYSILPAHLQTAEEEFQEKVVPRAPQAVYRPIENIPLTTLGQKLSGVVDVGELNREIHASIAKVLQLLLLTGVTIYIFRLRKSHSQTEIYFLSLALGCIGMLMMLTLLPRLSIDYSVIRMFQQALLICGLPMVAAAFFYARVLGKKYAPYVGSGILIFLFLHLSGFIPQLIGGPSAQLSLNNAGAYYEFFYTHGSDRVAVEWLNKHRNPSQIIFMDTNADFPQVSYPEYIHPGIVDEPGQDQNAYGYLYHNYINTTQNHYRIFLNSEMTGYTDPVPTQNRNLVYAGTSSSIYGAK